MPSPPQYRCCPRQLIFTCAVLVSLNACNHPDQANVLLRQENQKLTGELTELKTRHLGDEATITALQNAGGSPPAVSHEVVEKLFTVHGIQLGRLTGPDDWDATQPGDDGIKVSVVPVDEQGDKLKATGRVSVQLFDLAEAEKALIGQWKFDAKQVRESWYGGALQYNYILKCPWIELPRHAELTVKVTFVDELTGREFSAQKIVTVVPRASTALPTTIPATHPASTQRVNPA